MLGNVSDCCDAALAHGSGPPIRLCRGLLLICCVVLLCACSAEPEGPHVTRGEVLPNLILKGFDGQSIRLERFHGRLLILNVWAPWCAPCVEEMPSLDRLSRQLDPQRFAVIGLTVDDDRFLAEEFLRNNQISFSNYMDEKRLIAETILGVRSFPQTFVISPHGVLLARIIGWQEWDSQEVLSTLEEYYQASRLAPAATRRQTKRAMEGAAV